MKKCYPIQVIDIRFEVDHANRRKIQFCEEHRGDPKKAHIKARFFTFLIRHIELKIFPDGNENNENKVN